MIPAPREREVADKRGRGKNYPLKIDFHTLENGQTSSRGSVYFDVANVG